MATPQTVEESATSAQLSRLFLGEDKDNYDLYFPSGNGPWYCPLFRARVVSTFRQAIAKGIDRDEVMDELIRERRESRWGVLATLRNGVEWTSEEKQRLLGLRRWGFCTDDIAVFLSRTKSSVKIWEQRLMSARQRGHANQI